MPQNDRAERKGCMMGSVLLTSAITRGWHYGLRYCGRVGLITRCETLCSRDEVRKVQLGTDERWHNCPQAPPSFTKYLRGCRKAKRVVQHGDRPGAALCAGWIDVAC
jgi:hypothetical protein